MESRMRNVVPPQWILRYQGETLAYLADRYDGHYTFFEMRGLDDAWVSLLTLEDTPVGALQAAACIGALELVKLVRPRVADSSMGIWQAYIYDLRSAWVLCPQPGWLFIAENTCCPTHAHELGTYHEITTTDRSLI